MSVASGSMLGFRYVLEQRIGAGGYSEVWRAHDTVLDRPVAIKLLHPDRARGEEALVRFRNEAQLAGRLAHVNVARVYDFCESQEPIPPYLVMELIDGPSLSQVIDRGPLSPARTMDILAQAAAALQEAHAAGLVHRDVKPANMMIAAGGVVKLTDFGLSHTLASAPITGTGLLIGTPAYFAPERAAGARATPAGDLYSLGVVGYECLAGDVPFSGSPLEVASAHRELAFPPLPASTPPGVAEFIAQLTAKDPAARPASAGVASHRAAELRDQLMGWQTHAPQAGPVAQAEFPVAAGTNHPTLITELPSAEGGPADPPRRRRSVLVAAGIAAAAIAVIAGLAFANGGSPSTPPAASTPKPTAPAVRTVDVERAALIGEPVRLAVRQLRAAGFQVRVRLTPTWQARPGQVVAVTPAGKQPQGSLVTVTAATWPGWHHHHHGQGQGNGGGDGNGNGGGNG
jgi:tRNA A-37 threonylcarbamoyl transferase component Bud32